MLKREKVKKKAEKPEKSEKTEKAGKAKKAADDQPPKPKTAREFIESVQKDKHFAGSVQVQMASEAKTTYLLRRPTGILSLDLALGGGLHAGGSAEIYGVESSGKTHQALRVAGQLQRNYGEDANILIYSTEMKPDKTFMRKSGFCVAYSDEEIAEYNAIRATRGIPPFTEEEEADLKTQIGNVLYAYAATADKGLDLVLKGLEERIFQIIIIESLGAFLTPEVAEEYTGDRHYAGSSAIVTQFQNMAYPMLIMDDKYGRPNETTIIGVNQARAAIDTSGRGPKEKAAVGAYAWKHGQLVSIRLTKGSNLVDEDAVVPKNTPKPVIGKEVFWQLHKGKAGTHDGKTGSYHYYHVVDDNPIFWKKILEESIGGVDVVEDAINVGVTSGLIEQSGAWYNWEGRKFNGRGQIREAFYEDPELYNSYWDRVMAASGVMVRYK